MFLNAPCSVPCHRLKINGVVQDFYFPLSTGLNDRNGVEIFEGDVIDIDTDAALKFYIDTCGEYQVQKSLFDADDNDDDQELPPLLEFIEHCRELKTSKWFVGGKIYVRYNIGGFFLAIDTPNTTGWISHLSEVAGFAKHAFVVIKTKDE